MELADRVALVTGGGSGLGRAAALRLAAAGATVVVLGRTAEENAETAGAIGRGGGRALPVTADVADEAAMDAAFETIATACGRLDIVFANAGINGVWAPIADLSFADWSRTLAINLGGTFLTLRGAIPLLRRRGGSVVITSSINGTRTFTSPGAAAYAASKAAQVALMQMAALELARHGIRVNAICPGSIETRVDDNSIKINVAEAAVPAEYPEGQVPLTGGAPGSPAEVAELVLFLASDRSRHITGTPIWIDGGQSLLV